MPPDKEAFPFTENLYVEQIHWRVSDETGDEDRARALVEFVGRRVGLELALLHDGDAVGHGHGLYLIVGHVDGGDSQIELQAFDLAAHGQAQTGVQIRERFVEEEQAGLLHKGAAQGDALLLSTRELRWAAVEQMTDAHHVGDPLHALLHLRSGRFLEFEGVADVLADAHVRVEGVALEDHADVAVFGRDLVDDTVVEADLPGGRLVDTGNHEERGRLAAAGRAEEGNELSALDVEGDVVGAGYIAPAFGQVVQFDAH